MKEPTKIEVTEEMREALREWQKATSMKRLNEAANWLSRLVSEAMEPIERKQRERGAEKRKREEHTKAILRQCGTTDPNPVTLIVPTENHPVEVPVVEARGGLAITNRIGLDGKPMPAVDGFAITHIRSGLRVTGRPTLEGARSCVDALLKAGDWSVSQEEIMESDALGVAGHAARREEARAFSRFVAAQREEGR